MERINQLLNTKINLVSYIPGEEFTTYFDLCQITPNCSPPLKLTKEELSAVSRSIKTVIHHPDDNESEAFKLEDHLAFETMIDQGLLRKNLMKIYKKERLPFLLGGKLRIKTYDDAFYLPNCVTIGDRDIVIESDNKIDLIKEEVDAVVRSFDVVDGEEEGSRVLAINEERLVENFKDLYK